MKKILILTTFVVLALGFLGSTALADDGGYCQSINGESSICQ